MGRLRLNVLHVHLAGRYFLGSVTEFLRTLPMRRIHTGELIVMNMHIVTLALSLSAIFEMMVTMFNLLRATYLIELSRALVDISPMPLLDNVSSAP